VKKQYKTFVFGEDLEKIINKIPEDEQLRFYRIVTDYGLNGIGPRLNIFEAALWVQMKDMIDSYKKVHKEHGGEDGENQNI
jgi:hypothetical protein